MRGYRFSAIAAQSTAPRLPIALVHIAKAPFHIGRDVAGPLVDLSHFTLTVPWLSSDDLFGE